MKMKNILPALLLATFSIVVNAKSDQVSQSGTEPPVKKSSSGICHEKGSSYYSQTKKFTPFNSLEECVKSGGRAAKTSDSKKTPDTTQAADTKNSPETKQPSGSKKSNDIKKPTH